MHDRDLTPPLINYLTALPDSVVEVAGHLVELLGLEAEEDVEDVLVGQLYPGLGIKTGSNHNTRVTVVVYGIFLFYLISDSKRPQAPYVRLYIQPVDMIISFLNSYRSSDFCL